MRRVFISGASGYLGTKLLALMERIGEVERVVGVDVSLPRVRTGKLTFFKKDVREPLAQILRAHKVDTVLHAAWILPPLHDSKLMESVNMEGTRNVLRSSAEAGVERILHFSSTTAYGFHPDNPRVLTEESPLRGNAEFTYSKNKREAEEVCLHFHESHPGIGLTVLRPCFVCGPGFANPMARYLEKKTVVVPREHAPLQYVHEDDLVEAVRTVLEQSRTGVYNIAADGTISFPEMVRALGNHPLLLPLPVVTALTAAAWALRIRALTEFPPQALALLRYSWIASNQKLRRETGFRFRYTTREAFEDYARHVKARARSLNR
ncbi:MAG: NAD-dependent epimerase/dehydratase family protein [bacterium]